MNIHTYLAHAGEEHETVTTSVSHSIIEEWYVALPLYFLAVSGLVVATYFLTKRSKSSAFMMLFALLLVGGVSTYSLSPIVSVVSLSLGFSLVLLSVLAGIKQ